MALGVVEIVRERALGAAVVNLIEGILDVREIVVQGRRGPWRAVVQRTIRDEATRRSPRSGPRARPGSWTAELGDDLDAARRGRTVLTSELGLTVRR